MASAQKTSSKNKIKLSVNDEEKAQDKLRVSSSIRKLGKIVKDKINKYKQKPKNLENYDANNKNVNVNFVKNPNFNISSNNNENDNFAYINNKYNYALNLENKNVGNNFSNNFSNAVNLNNHNASQKQLKYKIDIQNNNTNVNSPFNITNNSNSNLNYSLKNQKENNLNNNNDTNNNFFHTNQFYISTEPEKQRDNFPSPMNKNNLLKKAPLHFETNPTNTNTNHKIKNNNNNFKKTNQNQDVNHGTSNKYGGSSNSNYNLNNLELQFKKSSSLINMLNKSSFGNINSVVTTNNLNNSNSKQKSNSKIKKINTQPLNFPNTGKHLTGSFIAKKDTQMQLETYSSHNDFIEDFFQELLLYINNAGLTSNNIDEAEKLSNIKSRVLNIFDNIFKNIITGQKPMESLDIDIKKKLSKFSEIWKKFLSTFEKNSLKSNAQKNPSPSYINKIDLSTKNVINHNHNHNINHNITSTEPCGSNLNNKSKINTNDNSVCGINCYNNLKKELEEKFTNLMKKEVNKIKGILEEKEKVIEDLQNQINIKNSYISEMQQRSMNNAKSKDLGTSNRLLGSDNFNVSKDRQDKASDKHINLDALKLKNNLQPVNRSAETKNENEELSNLKEENSYNKNLLKEEAENFLLKKKTIDTMDEHTELLLYDQKQFIRERRLLLSENKTLFDKVSEMEKLLNFQKEKEIKLMKLLFFLNKQGIPIDEIIQTHILTEKSAREEHSQIMRDTSQTAIGSYKSMDSLMYLPITLEQPTPYVKPQVIPVLDFTDINNKFNMEYDSGRKSNQNFISNNQNIFNVNNESSASFIDYNKYENENNYDNSIINDISKLDHKKNRGIDLRINLSQIKQKKKENEDLLKTSNDNNVDIGKTMKKNLSSLKLNLNNDHNNIEKNEDAIRENNNNKNQQAISKQSKDRFYGKEKIQDYNAENISPDLNKIKSEKAISKIKNTNSSNKNLVSNHVKFTEFSNYIIDRNISNTKTPSNKSKSKHKESNISNNNLQINSQLNNPVYMNSSYKKKPNCNEDENVSSIKNSSNFNMTEQSITKLHNDKLKLNLNLSLKDKLKELFKNSNKQTNS